MALALDKLMQRDPKQLSVFEQTVVLAQSMALRGRERERVGIKDILGHDGFCFPALYFASEYLTERFAKCLDTLIYEQLRTFAEKHYPEVFFKDGGWFAQIKRVLTDERFLVSDSVRRIIEFGYNNLYKPKS